ncbi:MAG: molybdenum ABC transporter ATP-binding protein [Desulfobulbaceae bacterium]|nr:molybdenum ABC transporter ATP-binding protein [Desulfobulbaceae bacterium]
MELSCDIQKLLGTFSFRANFHIGGSQERGTHLAGTKVGIFGPSGSGKSTLMLLLAGLLKPDKGRICLGETVLYDHAAGINLPPEQRRIGVVFQHARLFPHLSVIKNLLYGYNRVPRAQRCIQPEEIIRVLALEHLLERGVNLLSGGERQRVALGRTVLSCPRLILMDEPLSGLDENLKLQIIPYLNEVSAEFGLPLLFISHSLLEMRLMTNQVLLVEAGEVQELIATETLATKLWRSGRQSYINVLHLDSPRERDGIFVYNWGGLSLVLTEQAEDDNAVFELDARDILLFKRHPEATSARNLLSCTVEELSPAGNRVLVDLLCGDGGSTSNNTSSDGIGERGRQRLKVQIVPESVRELGLAPGREVVAAIKASSFRRAG